MYDKNIIQALKQVNVSKDFEKTKVRIEDAWKSAPKDVKKDIEETAGVARATIQRVYKTGTVSAKLVVPMAQTLDIDPRYLTGEVDEIGNCTDEIVKDFLIANGYEKLLSGKKKRSYTRRADRMNMAAPETEAEALSEETPSSAVEEIETAAEETEVKTAESEPEEVCPGDLAEDELILLLRGLLLKAKAGVTGAVGQVENVKRILLS